MEKSRLVTELAEQKLAIEQKNAQLAGLNAQRNSFLGIAVHDLRSPLTTILASSELMLMDDAALSDDERRQFTELIFSQTQHMLTLLNDLLDVTHIESGKFSVKPEQVDVSEFLQQTVARNIRIAEAKKMRLVLEAADVGSTWFDPLRIQQVMDNLLSNAVKYSPAGSLIRFRAKRIDMAWRIEVQDEGPGVRPEDRSRLFQDFARLSAQPTGGEKSTGLGLAITRRVVEAHGGTIGVDSEPGHGATFWFTLPGGHS